MRTFNEAQMVLGLEFVKQVTFKQDCRFPASGTIVTKGTTVDLYYSPKAGSKVYFQVATSPSVKTIGLSRCHLYFNGFKKVPSIKALEKMSNDAIVTTPTGHRVEPDGYGPDGLPSWLLVMGVI